MPMGPGAKTVLVGGWVGGWAGSPTGRYQDLETGTEWFTAEKGIVYQPKIIPQRDTRPQIRAACVPRDERHAARVPRAHRQAAYALRTCALRTAQESLFIHNANSHTTHTAREVVVRGSPSVSMGRLDAWRSAAWRVCRLKRRLLHGPRRCPQSRSPANRPRALVGLAVDDIWSGEADNLSERGAR